MKISSHLKTISYPIIFFCKGRNWLRTRKSNFTHDIKKLESYENNPPHTTGDAKVSVLGASGHYVMLVQQE